MSSINYPADFPFSELTYVVSTLKSGTAKSNLANLAHAMWIIQGYGLLQALGQPSVTSQAVVPVGQLPPSGDEQIQKLEELLSSMDPNNVAAQGLINIDWSTILPIIVQLLIKVLSQ